VHREEICPGGSRLSLIPIAFANRQVVKLPLSWLKWPPPVRPHKTICKKYIAGNALLLLSTLDTETKHGIARAR